MSEETGLHHVVDLIKEIVSGSRTGSAIDRYRIESLWDLGDKIVATGIDEGTIWYVVNSLLAKDGFVTQPTLLKNALRVRRYWATKTEFQRVASVLGSYGKLKDVIQIFNPEAGVPPSELDLFLAKVAGRTYVETLELASALKAKHIRREPTNADSDSVYDSIVSATSELAKFIEAGDDQAIHALRTQLSVEASRDTRLLLSSLQSPAVREKFAGRVRHVQLPLPKQLEAAGWHFLAGAFTTLDELRSVPLEDLHKLANDVGLSFLGDFATTLKATESPDERKRYLQNKVVLRKFLTSAVN